MGFTQTGVLCFVIDTTGSMNDDIAEVRRVTSSIIDSKTGSANQPSEYILVPFNDPGKTNLIPSACSLISFQAVEQNITRM